MASNTHFYNKLMEYQFVVDEVKRLKEQIADHKRNISNLQSKCDHRLLIYYDLKKVTFRKDILTSDLVFCPFCGKRVFTLELNENGKILLINKVAHFPNPEHKLRATSERYKNLLVNFHNLEHEKLLSDFFNLYKVNIVK